MTELGQDWRALLADAGFLQAGLLVLALLALVLALLWWRGRVRLARVQMQHQLALRDLSELRQAQSGLEDRLAAEAARAADQALRLSRAEALADAGRSRLSDLTGERDNLTDALHEARQRLAGLETQLETTRLSARKDAEAAARDIATLRELRDEMTGQFRLMATETLRRQGADMQKSHSEQLSALLTPFREQVNRFQSELQARNKATDEERARLREQIEFLHKRSEDISREAVALTRALKGEKQRQGAWGEMILERILEDSGLEAGTHYTTQDSWRDEGGKLWRPDVVVRMPRAKVLVIDSKVSLNAYEESVNAEDDTTRSAALRRHVEAIRTHVKTLSAKGYEQIDDASVDYVLMFIPIEGAFSEALRADPGLAAFAMENRIGLATPTTLMLTLRTVEHIWMVEKRESNALAIAQRAGALYDKVHGFLSSMEDVGQALDKASRAHTTAMDRLTRGQGNVVRQVQLLRDLGARASKKIELDHDAQDDPPPQIG